ncbi:MAG: phosphopantetheine-binding protein [bacterium]
MEEDQAKDLAEVRKRVKELLVDNLSLEDIKVQDIRDDELLFGEEGLGLDSLDAVEIVVLLQRNFGLELKDIDQGRKIFYSIDTLARYIYENREGTVLKERL